MRLADDDRARVPFALVGVVLLVASATAAATLAGQSPVPSETRTDRAVEHAKTSADTALASAARTAAAEAVRNPVVTPANTSFGAAIDPAHAFRDALALRVYARTERALRGHESTAGAVSASVSLPRLETTADAERAIERIALERVGGDLIRVTLSGVRVDVERDGQVVSQSTTNVSTTVHSPALALRDRVQRFERLLDRGAFDGPGLDRRLTDYLHRVVWLRGPLQYAGVPISNVLANRHVELMANRALLDVQRTAFGREDDAGRAAYGRALARVGLGDVLALVEGSAKKRAGAVLDRTGGSATPTKAGLSSALDAIDQSSQSVPVGVNATADRAFLDLVERADETSLDGTLRAAYTSLARRTVDTALADRSHSQSGHAPANWTLVSATDDRDVEVDGAVEPSDVLAADQRAVETYGRRVVVTERETRRYTNGNRSRRVVETTESTYRVSVGVSYEVQPPARELPSERAERVLDADIVTVTPAVHDRIASRAKQSLVADAGGIEALARRAVAGDDALTREALIRPDVPQSVRKRAYRAAATLRTRSRNVSADVSTRGLASGRVPVDTLRDRVVALHDARDSYGSATDRAVAAVRETYLARVAGRLGERRADGALASIGEALGDRGLEVPPTDHGSEREAGPVSAVEGAPAYLTLAEVSPRTESENDARYHPLVARNVNWFTIPHGDAASAVVDAAMPEPPESVRIGTAAQALLAVNGTLAAAPNRTLHDQRAELRAAVSDSVSAASREYRSVLAASPRSFTERERQAATRRAFERWDTVHARGMAVGNGSAAAAVAAEAARIADATPQQRDQLATRLRAASAEVADSEAVRVESTVVRDTANLAHRIGGAITENALSEAGSIAAEQAAERLGAADVGAVPAGLPVAPVPGFWYATANAWSVSVRGSYARFTVRADGGSPVGPGEGTAYVRENASVAFDVDGDGDVERVGRNERVSFEVEATVGVVVPAGPRGVGDVDGNADEQSAGW
ncbi:DUF7286 family protein [Halobacterium noricense]|uniref:DUF7286 family protein n=1 Tax=Halobacterium noricense TaxID=223182 RepID=UPI001E512B0E|nr:hypothetical protein [Halobacterium noricense]UHH25748.1 hypothetical protein LT974_02160 [Halobacterium noricense]